MDFFSLQHLLQLLHTYGYPALAGIIAVECIGFPLPGEALLIAAAVLASTTGQMNISLVVASAASGAIVGQLLGYWIGWAVGFRLLRRYGRYIGLNDRRLAFGRALFRRHGVKVIIASRFVVLLRALAGLLAGANHMPLSRFLLSSIVGSVAWASFYGFAAYALGHEARQVAGPVAIAVGIIVIAALVAGGLYVRRREHALLHEPAGDRRPSAI